MIDLPQVVDVIANPRGAEFLDRDAANVARWFSARGLTGVSPGPGGTARAAAARSPARRITAAHVVRQNRSTFNYAR